MLARGPVGGPTGAQCISCLGSLLPPLRGMPPMATAPQEAGNLLELGAGPQHHTQGHLVRAQGEPGVFLAWLLAHLIWFAGPGA